MKQNQETQSSLPRLTLTKKHLLILTSLTLLIFIVGGLLLIYGGKKKSSDIKAPVVTPVMTEDNENSITVESEPMGVIIQPTEACLATKTTTPFTCKLTNAKDTIITAPERTTFNNQEYTFATWEGCSVTNQDKKVCTVSLKDGTAAKIKAFYAPNSLIETNQPQSNAPYFETRIDGYSSIHFPGEVPTFMTDQKTKDVTFEIITKNVDLNTCSVVHESILDDSGTKQIETLKATASQKVVLYDGTYNFHTTCKVSGQDRTITMKGRVADRQPKLCKGFSFSEGALSVSNIEELKGQIVGHWEGCVFTPWVPAYFVTIDFFADGTYQAVTDEVLDGIAMNAMYYGTQEPTPLKKYYLDYFQDGHGTGQIDIAFNTSGNTNRGSLGAIKITNGGSTLSFEFFHRSQYGPLIFKLHRT